MKRLWILIISLLVIAMYLYIFTGRVCITLLKQDPLEIWIYVEGDSDTTKATLEGSRMTAIYNQFMLDFGIGNRKIFIGQGQQVLEEFDLFIVHNVCFQCNIYEVYPEGNSEVQYELHCKEIGSPPLSWSHLPW